jgi:hypothetical protein
MRHPQHKRSLWLGSLAAAIAPPICILVPEMFRLSGRGSFGYLLSNSVVFLAIAIPVSLVAVICLGLPYVLWLRSRSWLDAIAICAGATVIGAAVFSLLVWGVSWDHRLPGLPHIGLGAALGLGAGISFSLATGLTMRSSRTRFVTPNRA